jgi:hypothetical protein
LPSLASACPLLALLCVPLKHKNGKGKLAPVVVNIILPAAELTALTTENPRVITTFNGLNGGRALPHATKIALRGPATAKQMAGKEKAVVRRRMI